MKVLLINGSSRRECTFTALSKVAESLNEEGIETEIISIGGNPIRDCIACGMCTKNGDSRCVFKDDVVNRNNRKSRKKRWIYIWYTCILCSSNWKNFVCIR